MKDLQHCISLRKSSSPAKALKFALTQQVILIIFAGMILDGGRIAEICLFGFIAFWMTALLLVFRRKTLLTKFDIAFMQGGSLPLCLLSYLICMMIWRFRNVW